MSFKYSTNNKKIGMNNQKEIAMEGKRRWINLNTISDIFAAISVVITIIVYQRHFTQYKKELRTQQTILNNTIVSDQSYLVFNRVPKAGSEMLWTLIDQLADKNNFTSYSDSPKAKEQRGAENTYLTTRDGRKYYVDMWAPKTKKSVKDERNLNNIESGTERMRSTNWSIS